MKEVIYTPEAPEPIGPYSQAIRIDNTVYVSGQIALDVQKGELQTKSISQETKQVLTNIRHILNEAGLDFSHVVKCSIFIKDMNQFAQINAVYGEYFTSNPPARETVEVSALPKGANVEISCIAVG